MDTEYTELWQAALRAVRRASPVVSKFAVGAAVRTSSGSIAYGANIESEALGTTNCAERVAIQTAIMCAPETADVSNVVSSVLAVDAGGAPLAPCGQCRQLIAEYGRDATVWLQHNGTVSRMPIQDLLPHRFEFPLRGDPAELFARSRLHSERSEIRARLDQLRIDLAASRPYIEVESVRAFIFVEVNGFYVIPPGLFSSSEPPDGVELTIKLGPQEGITGYCGSSRKPNYGRPLKGVPGGEPVTKLNQLKTNSKLDWIISKPLEVSWANFVLAVDGLHESPPDDQVTPEKLQDMLDSTSLKTCSDRLASYLNALPSAAAHG